MNDGKETKKHRPTEIEKKADFSIIRYAQCWEDADVLLEGLDIQAGENCLSIASAGDNTLALLSKNPGKVFAIDLNPTQLYCLELRVSAYKALEYKEILSFMGSRPGTPAERKAFYAKCRGFLEEKTAVFWDALMPELEINGLGGIGKFERYFRIFRKYIIPLTHGKKDVLELFQPKSPENRRIFFEKRWLNLRWRMLIRLFFSQTAMGRLGRDPAFFTYVKDSFSAHVSRKIEQGLAILPPEKNPYIHWIFTGTHNDALPAALREENFDIIRNNLDRLEWRLASTSDFCDEAEKKDITIHKFNLSNIFEYMSEKQYDRIYSELVAISRTGGRLFYWNMLAPRNSDMLKNPSLVRHLADLSVSLTPKDKAVLYNRLLIDEVI